MKIVAIGDIHGRKYWADIIAKESDADVFVFNGDYFDTFLPITAEEQIENFSNIIEFKRANPEKVMVLMGNHDYHYIMDGEEYSGFQDEAQEKIGIVVGMALSEGLMQKAYAYKDYLFTHAGVTKSWSTSMGITGFEAKHITTLINELPLEAFKFHRPDSSGYGEHPMQSPIWVRPRSLAGDMIENFTQVVGHTQQKELKPDGNPILIDTLGAAEYLVIEDFTPRKEPIWKL